jgi:hypothetical protein
MTKQAKTERWRKIEIIAVVISTIVACISAFFSAFSAYQANQTANRLLAIEENRKLNENKEKSLAFIDEFYEKIMNTPELYAVYDMIGGNTSDFIHFVDEFEWLGAKYCQEQIYRRDLVDNYRFLFEKVCQNEKIVDFVSQYSRNALSKLCLDII